MKKIIGILGVAVFAMTMFFNANTMNSSTGDFDLASLTNMHTANAELMCPDGNGGYFGGGNIFGTDCFNTKCVCKNGTCSEGSAISFRRKCGSTDPQDPNAHTDANCAAQASSGAC